MFLHFSFACIVWPRSLFIRWASSKFGLTGLLSFNNGKEFSGHRKIAEELDILCFFARPYHSWERGLNEHTNELLRQFFPKGTNFLITKSEDLESAVDLINNRPRKSLDYRTPFEVFCRDTSGSVALQI
jgi:transposase, IS30 family